MSTDGPIARQAYEELAEAYAARVDTKPHNAHYERPATLSLLPDVNGLRILDAGCGPGAYAEWLVNHGAQVVGVDVSEKMIALARRRVGAQAEFRVLDLERRLPFADASFDLVVSPLVPDYVRDWRALFAEFNRVLRPGGRLIFSSEHPCSRWRMQQATNYFSTELTQMEWRGFGKPVTVPSYRRPLQEVLNPLVETGFRIERILEPVPTETFRKHEPRDYEELSRRPGFLCVRAVKPA